MHEPAKTLVEVIFQDEERKQESMVFQFQSICDNGQHLYPEPAPGRRTEIWQPLPPIPPIPPMLPCVSVAAAPAAVVVAMGMSEFMLVCGWSNQ